jgi:hypothetical protein
VSKARLITKAAISEFASLVDIYRKDAYRVWLISPWIGQHTDGSLDPLQLLIDAVRESSACMMNVITREPLKTATYHQHALRLLRENIQPVMYFCENLHTKLYVLEANGFTAAVLGSPNFTAGGNKANVELAVELRDTAPRPSDDVGLILRDVVRYANDLLQEEHVVLVS